MSDNLRHAVAYEKLLSEKEALESRLRAASELPHLWRTRSLGDGEPFSSELEAALRRGTDDYVMLEKEEEKLSD